MTGESHIEVEVLLTKRRSLLKVATATGQEDIQLIKERIVKPEDQTKLIVHTCKDLTKR